MSTVHLSRVTAADPQSVYDFARDPHNLPRWAAGLASGPVRVAGGELLVDSPMGAVRVRFVECNSFGVLDHDVTLPDGTVVTNPMRVLPHPEGSEIVFTLRQLGASSEDFARDERMVAEDLARLAALVENLG